MYVDDIGLESKGNSFEQLEDTINKNLNVFQNYFISWHLILNVNKTMAVIFLYNISYHIVYKIFMECKSVTVMYLVNVLY